MTTLTDELNQEFFDGQLGHDVSDEMRLLKGGSEEFKKIVRRVFERMNRASIRPQDINIDFALNLTTLFHIVDPQHWKGGIPQATTKGRHAKIDRYIARNRWQKPMAAGKLLDLACGFPPLTTIETAEMFEAWQVIGADAYIHPFVLYNHKQDYASIDKNGRVAFCQPTKHAQKHWTDFFANIDVTVEEFQTLYDKLKDSIYLANGEGSTVVEIEGARLVYNPIKDYERNNLRFIEGRFGEFQPGLQDVIRAFNVLMFYDFAFLKDTLKWIEQILNEEGLFIYGCDWVETSNCRAYVYQKIKGRLKCQEFMMSLDFLRPSTPFNYSSFSDDDPGIELVTKLVGLLRQNQTFIQEFDADYDKIATEIGFAKRKPDGYLSGPIAGLDAEQLGSQRHLIGERMSTFGYADKAASTLHKHGIKAWVNEIGMLSVDPNNLGAV